mmetsp:Transcript_35924/g.78710  ORF Transcript_35924/g.78710 Transcript_35924/m.78710 type:complete len:288 (-) Transcript_35924:246-1109(-)
MVSTSTTAAVILVHLLAILSIALSFSLVSNTLTSTSFVLHRQPAAAFAPPGSLPTRPSTCTVKASSSLSSSKWDNLVDDDDDDDSLDFGEDLPGPRDMRYIEFNIGRQNRNFVDIRTAGGPEMTNDVYARKAGDDTFWFAGKVARVSDVSPELAVARQWSLIETHAARLRPIELYPSRGKLELWIAPGDSEMDVAYNRPDCKFVQMKRPEDLEGVGVIRQAEIGFQGEIYEGGEDGFRTWRHDDGSPVKPEITDTPDKGEKRAPNDDEMKDIQEILKGKDLNEFFDD